MVRMTMLRALMQTAARIRAFFRRDDLDRDFADELDAHLAMLADDYVRRGMTPEQARRAAIIRVGAPVSLREQHRAARGLPGLEGIAQDVRFACRLIARDRWFSAAIAAALALGIGANTIGFTIVNATLLREMPGENGDRLYTISWRNRSGGGRTSRRRSCRSGALEAAAFPASRRMPTPRQISAMTARSRIRRA